MTLLTGSAMLVSLPACAICSISLPDEYVDNFVRHPGYILEDSPAGGQQLQSKIRGLSLSGFNPLKAIESIVPKANIKQKEAIGEGMARANEECSSHSGELVRRIEESVRRMREPIVTRAYVKYLSQNETPVPIPDESKDDEPRKRSFDIDTPAGGVTTRGDFLNEGH